MNHLRDKIYKKYNIEPNANFWTGMVIGWIVLIIIGVLLKGLKLFN